jgi:hypothetical protein
MENPMAGSQLVSVYQFRVVLRGISPLIWRRLLLRSDQSIADLHYAIQIAMGWSDSHLHRFHIHGKDYGVAHVGGMMFDDDPEKIPLADFQFGLHERFLYEYDFYDSWEHDVRLEKILPWESRRIYPRCAGGQRLAPPEDSTIDYFAITIGTGGAFEFRDIPPGEYYVVAFDQPGKRELPAQDLPYSIASQATGVRIEAGSAASVSLRANKWPWRRGPA